MIIRTHKKTGKKMEIVKWPLIGRKCVVKATLRGVVREFTCLKKDFEDA